MRSTTRWLVCGAVKVLIERIKRQLRHRADNRRAGEGKGLGAVVYHRSLLARPGLLSRPGPYITRTFRKF